jgi:hypothetical protein
LQVRVSLQLIPEQPVEQLAALESWAGREVEGLPDLVEQVRLVGKEVLPQLG